MEAARQILETARKKKTKIVTAESCTGGMIAAALTDIPGASDIFERGFVTYSNESKIELLGVPEWVIGMHGAVSAQTAKAMARGAIENSHASISIAVTGIAGPDGGTAEKPVGLVYVALAVKNGELVCKKCMFSGNRDAIRKKAVSRALSLLHSAIKA